jgi:hypothetical protein
MSGREFTPDTLPDPHSGAPLGAPFFFRVSFVENGRWRCQGAGAQCRSPLETARPLARARLVKLPTPAAHCRTWHHHPIAARLVPDHGRALSRRAGLMSDKELADVLAAFVENVRARPPKPQPEPTQVLVCKQAHSAIARSLLSDLSRATHPCSRKSGRPPASS